ncbi:STAS domain-containing protein [Legionella sp.]|uniref:STAS domain-containing protein n=1 Tax=Legionella sp. TaxID=459 RepID=UPI003CA4D2FA
MKTVHFKPGAELTFKTIVEVQARLYRALQDETSDHFTLDLSDVTHCDSAGIALLIEARKRCKNNNKTFKIVDMPLETQSLADFCGVKNILEMV